MAFVHFPQKLVEPTNIQYEQYILKCATDSKSSTRMWGVTVPISMAGGGSIQLGIYNTKEKALEQTKSYFDSILERATTIPPTPVSSPTAAMTKKPT